MWKLKWFVHYHKLGSHDPSFATQQKLSVTSFTLTLCASYTQAEISHFTQTQLVQGVFSCLILSLSTQLANIPGYYIKLYNALAYQRH